jgi:hypothetical protein
MPMDDTAAYLATFGAAATLAGAALLAIVDTAAEIVLDDVITISPAAFVLGSDAPAAAAGQALVADGITYTVRQVLRMPPDGAMLRLILARA